MLPPVWAADNPADILKAYNGLYLRGEVGYPKSGKMFLGRCTFRMLEGIREVFQVTIRHS